MILSILLVLIIATLLVIIVLLRRQMVASIQNIEDTLSKVEKRQLPDNEELYTDTLTGKVNVRIKRIYEMLNFESRINQEKAEHIQQLISDIAHQVKTPIANMKMVNETLMQNNVSETKKVELNTYMQQQIEKLDQLIQEMLKTSRLETGTIELSPIRTNIFDTLVQVISNVTMLAEKKKIDLYVNCPSDIYAYCDEQWTSEALFNILDNAIKYTAAHGAISITCEAWEVYTKISIIDNGHGIAESEQAQIFQRFYRGQSSQMAEGFGIGLYLAREIIQKQGGYIKINSELGKGTEFAVFLQR